MSRHSLLLGWMLITASQAMNIEHPQMPDHEHDESRPHHIQSEGENLYHSRKHNSLKKKTLIFYSSHTWIISTTCAECYQDESMGEIFTPCPPQPGVLDPPEIR